ncbi:hypothetical protein ACIBI9_62680 [Nonomuraea sp. NPDC050451]|uniref:hypothetical protein n=1 Tax=Nonomuraea sp. NPDC050451 TaxID=3364364 RepID=UPI00379E8458
MGIFATSMRDVIAMDAVLVGGTVSPGDSRPITLVVPRGELLDDCDPEVRRPFEARMALLASQGVKILKRSLPALEAAKRVLAENATIVEAEAHARYGHLLRSSDGVQVDHGIMRPLAGFAARPGDAGPVYEAMRGLPESAGCRASPVTRRGPGPRASRLRGRYRGRGTGGGTHTRERCRFIHRLGRTQGESPWPVRVPAGWLSVCDSSCPPPKGGR